MTREDRKEVANKHVALMRKEHSSAIEYSIKHSHVYRNINLNKTSKYTVFIEKTTSEEAVTKYSKEYEGGLCVLNFASFKHPGGGFINGSIAQEEALCHSSTLYNVLSDDKFKKEYEQNNQQEHLHDGIYEDFGIFSPNIIFTDKDNKTYTANVLTVAAPNKSAYKNRHFSSDDYVDFDNALTQRINYLLHIMKLEHQEVLILGAFGCGVFGNDSYQVATIFKKLLDTEYRDTFKTIIFAIPDDKNMMSF